MDKPATPLPWAVIEDDTDISIDGEGWLDGQFVNGWVVVGNQERDDLAVAVIQTGAMNSWDDEALDANAAYIVTACNAYPHLTAINAELVEALEQLVEEYARNVDSTRLGGFYLDPETEHCVIDARAALARAKEASHDAE